MTERSGHPKIAQAKAGPASSLWSGYKDEFFSQSTFYISGGG